MHSEAAGVAEGALESARLAAMRSSDATVAIDACLRVMDAPQLEAALPSVLALLSRGTGLPTRAGTARFIVQLAQQQPLLLQPHAPKLLRTLYAAALGERSEVARSAYSAAAAQVSRGATADVLGKLVSDLQAKYVSDAGGVEDDLRLAIGMLLRELLRGATDAMNRVRAEWVPLVFLGKFEPRSQREVADAPTNAQKDERGKLATVFLEAYDEAGIGPSALGLHLGEIVGLLTLVVEGPSWALRRAAAFGLLALHAEVPATTLGRAPAAITEQMERLAVMLREKKWRDKEGDAVERIGKLAAAARPAIAAAAKTAAAEADDGAADDGPDSADM